MSGGPSPDRPEPAAAEADPGLDIDVLRRRRERVLTFAAILLIFAVTGAAAYLTLRTPPVDRRVIVDAAQRTIRETIGVSNKFDFATPVRVETTTQDEFLVRGEFVTVDDKPTITHYWYECLVRRQSDGTWGPDQLKLLPQ